jgi:choline dehydrogenase
MAYQRGSKKSYEMWADLVGDESYRWEGFLPYFKKSLHFTPPDASKRAVNATAEYDDASLGDGKGPLSVTFSNYAQSIASWVQKGLSEIGVKPIKGFTSGDILGSSYVMQAIQAETQTRESSETAFLQPALARSNLIVFQQSLAKKVVFDDKKSATGVLVDTDGKKYTLSAKNEVILSAGAFRSPQLLMVSGVGPSETLQQYGIPVIANRAGVGQNMWVSNRTVT